MKSFRFVAPASLEAAAALLAEEGPAAMPLAGGTDLLGMLKDRVHSSYPELLVGLKSICGLDYVREDGGGLAIGALTRLATLAAHPLVRGRYALLAAAVQAVASPQVRTMGTVGGNLCQQPRCWYYRSPDDYFHCARKGGRSCPARRGDNRYHSIFGRCTVGTRPGAGGVCVAVAASDLAPALVALRAAIKTTARVLAAADFFATPPAGSTVLAPGELVEEIRLPALAPGGTQAYQKFRLRGSVDFGIVGVASLLQVEAGRIAEARLVLGAVAPVPLEATEAEALLLGRRVTVELAEEASAMAVRAARPLSGNSYKIQITRELVKRAVLQANVYDAG